MEQLLRFLNNSPEYVNLKTIPALVVDLRYATTNNFTGENLYGAFNQLFLCKLAAEKLGKAVALLHEQYPGYKFIVFDALRPRSIQRLLWSKVVGTDQEKYIANPDKGSMHNFGLAIDLSLLDPKGNELDMGTAFDAFTDLAEPCLEHKFWQQGKLTDIQMDNRKRLRELMEQAGFIQLPWEWWHFDALAREQVRADYNIVE